jgi:hypothetical protein
MVSQSRARSLGVVHRHGIAPLAGAFRGLLASGILKLQGLGKVHTWGQLFLVEGLIAVGLADYCVLTLTDGPERARWLSAEDKALAQCQGHGAGHRARQD